MSKRAPVQSNKPTSEYPIKPAGTISWAEHLEAFEGYAKKWGRAQDADRIAARSGFCYSEICEFLGHEPKTWEAK